ncbi:MAG: 3-deoxy-D-manno-octulosonic acid kinase [Gammaproteobacteria bacterium]
MARRVIKSDGSTIVYDDDIVSQMTADLFEPACWPDAETVPGYSGGRGDTLFINHEGNDWVLRHYHRGGLVGRFLQDHFLWNGKGLTRPFIEWDVLFDIQKDDLPAPVPVAARYIRKGWLYTADLITIRLPDVVPFSNRLQQGPASPEVWAAVGRCVGKFHAAGYFHADLSTHNLQIDPADNIYLLDFDRGSKRSPGNWQQQNIDRLHRSCIKITRDFSVQFTAVDWGALMEGYREQLDAK